MTIQRQTIMDALGTRLEGITALGGYNLNLGHHVFEWKTSKWEDEAIPGISYRDPDDEVEEAGQQDLHRLRVEFEVMVSGDQGDVPTLMRQAVSDVSAAMAVDETFGGLVLYCRTLSINSTDIEQAGKKYGWVKMSITMVYATVKWGV